MLFDYTAPTFQPERAGSVWSQFPLQPLAPGALTPFSHSVLAELTSRAWYLYYDRLGFDPTPRSRVVRRHQGRVYFNLSLCSQLEADHAAIEPLALRVNGTLHPLATWEKPGFLAGFKVGRAQKRIDDTLADYARRMDEITERARTWYRKTQAIKRWGQAEVLQIMEEIERVGVDSMAAFLAARLNLGLHYGRLAAALEGKVPASQSAFLINAALGHMPNLVEHAMLHALPALTNTLRDADVVTWLQAGNFGAWRSELPAPAAEGITAFLDAYGHRTAYEGEIARPRWTEDATLLLHALRTQTEAAPKFAAHQADTQPLLALVPASARKEAEQNLHKIADLHALQSRALHAMAYIWSGTRTWALAAAREAMVDTRLHHEEEVFLFELEEIKQMMTGEWNISSLDEIRAMTSTRRAEHATIEQSNAPDLLIGDDAAFVTHRCVAGVAGTASAPLAKWNGTGAPTPTGAVVATELLDSGALLALPLASAFVAAAGAPYDPFVLAAPAWSRPVVIGLGKDCGELVDGATTTVRVGADVVTVTQG